jgi:trimethylamine corrinoid protein
MDVKQLDLDLEAALLEMDRAQVLRILQSALSDPEVGRVGLGDRLVTPTLSRIGEAWEGGHVALSQVYMSGRILEECLDELATEPIEPVSNGHIAIAVLGDRHALGKRIIRTVLRTAGYRVADLGTGLTAEEIADAVQRKRPRLLMLSVLMHNTALRVSAVRAELAARGITDLPIVAGGAPFILDPELGQRVEADAVGRSAADALAIAARVMGGVS